MVKFWFFFLPSTLFLDPNYLWLWVLVLIFSTVSTSRVLTSFPYDSLLTSTVTSTCRILLCLTLRWALFSFCLSHFPARPHLILGHDSDLLHFQDDESWNPLLFLPPSFPLLSFHLYWYPGVQVTYSITRIWFHCFCSNLNTLVNDFNFIPLTVTSVIISQSNFPCHSCWLSWEYLQSSPTWSPYPPICSALVHISYHF